VKQYVADIKRLFKAMKPSLESASIREDFGQIIVCLESRTFDGMASEVASLQSDIVGRGDNALSPQVKIDESARRIYYLPPERSSEGLVDYKAFVGALKNEGVRLAACK